jgi:hypothetical protein
MGTGHNVVLAPGYNQTRLSQTTSLWREPVGAADQSDGVSGALDVAKHQAHERRIQIEG